MCSMIHMDFMLPYNACFTVMLYLKNAVLCNVMPCNLALIYHHFRKTCVLHHSLSSYSEDESFTFLQNTVTLLPDYMASLPKIHYSSVSAIRPSLPWICVCVCVCMRMHACMSMHVCMCIYVCTYVCRYVCIILIFQWYAHLVATSLSYPDGHGVSKHR